MQTLEQLKAGKLTGTQKLKLSCGLDYFPTEIIGLADSLEVLDMTGNNLSQLPDSFGLLKNLKIAFFSTNNFTELPPILSQCTHLDIVGFKANKIKHFPEDALPHGLRWLILTDNQIEAIPESIGKCTRLQKVMLAGNKLTSLPNQMAHCKNIELLRISANQLKTLPSWLTDLPILSWLAYAGNPCSHTPASVTTLPEISWKELVIEKQLGEGASGVIAKAHSRNSSQVSRDIAVKVFKGDVTSDGLPRDEMEATIAAGFHPNLVTVLGKVVDHPDNKEGLVLELIPPTYKNLAGPPDFITCTRDTFPGSPVFSIVDIITISSGIASAAKHLHSRGIMHGDLYAHNILVNEKSEPLFGDFGAATLYKKSKDNFHEPIEVRAFGCLLEDLLNHIHVKEKDGELFKVLSSLKEVCMNKEIRKRPDFETISKKLDQLKSDLNC